MHPILRTSPLRKPRLSTPTQPCKPAHNRPLTSSCHFKEPRLGLGSLPGPDAADLTAVSPRLISLQVHHQGPQQRASRVGVVQHARRKDAGGRAFLADDVRLGHDLVVGGCEENHGAERRVRVQGLSGAGELLDVGDALEGLDGDGCVE